MPDGPQVCVCVRVCVCVCIMCVCVHCVCAYYVFALYVCECVSVCVCILRVRVCASAQVMCVFELPFIALLCCDFVCWLSWTCTYQHFYRSFLVKILIGGERALRQEQQQQEQQHQEQQQQEQRQQEEQHQQEEQQAQAQPNTQAQEQAPIAPAETASERKQVQMPCGLSFAWLCAQCVHECMSACVCVCVCVCGGYTLNATAIFCTTHTVRPPAQGQGEGS